MPEVSSLFNGVQIGPETTPGTGVAASKLINYLNMAPSFWAGNFNTQTPMGQKASAGITPGQDYSSWAVSSDVGSYSELIYPFCGLFTNVTPTTVDTTAKLWTFVPTGRSEDTIKTYTVETGSATRAQKAAYVLFTGLDLTFNRTDGVKVTGGAALGQAIQDNITLTATPTAVEDQPMLPTHLDVFLDPTSGAVGTTKLTRDFNAVFSYDNARTAVWPINSANASYVSHTETFPKCQISLTVAADQDGVKAVTYVFDAIYDAAWGTGQYLKIALQNKTAAL